MTQKNRNIKLIQYLEKNNSLKVTTMKYYVLILFLFFACKQKPNSQNQKVDFYPNGKIKFIKNYEDHLLNGMSIWFFPNGKMQECITFVNGEAEGHAYYFYESGALKTRRVFKNDKPVGYLENYYDHSIGIVKSILVFNDSGKIIYKKELDTSGRVLFEKGSY